MTTVEDREVVRLRTDLERRVAAMHHAYDLVTEAVVHAVVEAGMTWSEVAQLVLGDPRREATMRRDYADHVDAFRAGYWVPVGDRSPALIEQCRP